MNITFSGVYLIEVNMCDAECISLSGLKLKWYSSDEQDGRYDRIRKRLTIYDNDLFLICNIGHVC